LQDASEQLREFGEIFSLGFYVAGKKSPGKNITENLIDLLIEMRQKLREKKDWQLILNLDSETAAAHPRSRAAGYSK